MRKNWKAWAPIRGKRQQDPGADQERPQTNGTEQGQANGHTEQEKTTTGQGEGQTDPGEQMRKNLHGVEHHREPIRGTTCTPIRYGRDRGSRIPENWKNTQRQQHRPKRGQQGTPIREPCNGWEILAENRRKSP